MVWPAKVERFIAQKILRARAKESNPRRPYSWSLDALESRVLLAGDLSVALETVAPNDAGDERAEVPSTSVPFVMQADGATQSFADIVFIDARVADIPLLQAEVAANAEFVLIDSERDGLAQIGEVLVHRSNVRSLHIISHGSAGTLQLGKSLVTAHSLRANASAVQLWQNALHRGADILLYGCETGHGQAGTELVTLLAQLTGADVAASVDKTGAASLGGDWELEKVLGAIETEIAFSPRLRDHFASTLAISIRAAGATGQENMSLLIDGVAVQSWTNIGGNYNNRQFQTFTYNGATGITADRIRVAFTNDQFVAGVLDRNLRVDSITVDGQTFESEAPSVFSTGTWTDANGIAPGFWNSEELHGNGYFQYGSPPGNGSLITVSAAGSTGQESMQLLIDGNVVQTWNNVSGNASTGDFQTFTFQAPGNVTPDRVRVAFINDLFDPANGIDRNLSVARISIDGTNYASDAPTVFSTGSWDETTSSVSPGFLRTQTLVANGYFQYATAPSGGSTVTVFAQGATGQEQMQLQIDGIAVRTWDNVQSGTVQAYTYQANELISANRVRVAFTNDLYVAGSLDRNLIVDRIAIDSVNYETEAPSVFSNGTYVGDNLTPGFPQSEVLHTNGYFQYDALGANAGVISLASSVYSVNESVGSVTLTISRNQGSSGVVTVDYRTINVTATAGSDYSARTGTVSFANGQTAANIVVPITNDSLSEGNETFGFAIDNVIGGATLLVPRTATVTIIDDDVALPSFANFSNVANLRLNANATQANNTLLLTPAQDSQKGSAFFRTPLPITTSTSFQTNFGFRVDGGQGTAGADGFTFILQNSPAGINAIAAQDGGTLGAAGITNSLIIEFDSYQNPGDISDNHISVVINGQTTAIAERSSSIDLNGGANLRAWIDYNGETDRLGVYLSNTNVKPTSPLLTANVDLAALVGNQAFVGFTAATGGARNNHRILDWQMDLSVPTINDPTPGATLLTETIVTGLSSPTAARFTPDGRNLYVAQQDGRVFVLRDGQRQATPFIDISAQVNGTRDRGLLDIAVHPDFENNPYVYLLFTYDPPEVFANASHPLAGPDRNGNRAGRLIRVTADAATNYTRAVAGSEVVLLGTNSTWNNFNGFVNSTTNFNEPAAGVRPDGTNLRDFINTDSESHTVGSLAFGTDGNLFVSIGDGASYNQVDPRAVRVQDIDNLSGKILRINPLTGAGLADNPFYNGDPGANRSKVYQSGLRNPFRISVDSATGELYVGDVGWTRWEEINSAGPGANFGWPYYEGGSGNNLRTTGYQDLPAAAAFYASGAQAEPSILALNHSSDGINAIIMGAVYRGSAYPAEYQGDLFFNDLGQGIVRHVSLDAAGNVTGVNTFTTGAQVVVQIIQGPDGNLYFVDLDDGRVGRWVFV